MVQEQAPIHEVLFLWSGLSSDLYRIGGAVLGVSLAFLVAWPAGWRDFLSRLLISLICGMIFAPPLRQYLEWEEFPRLVVAAAATCSFLSWWVLFAIVRVLKSTNKLPFIGG